MIKQNISLNNISKHKQPSSINALLKLTSYLGLFILGLSALFAFTFIFVYPLCYLAIKNKVFYSVLCLILALSGLVFFFYYKLKQILKEKRIQGLVLLIKNWAFKLLMLNLFAGYIIINIVIYSFLEKFFSDITYSLITILLVDLYLFFCLSFLFFFGYYKRLLTKFSFIFFCSIFFLNIIYWTFVFIINRYYFYPLNYFLLIFVFFFLLKISKIKAAKEKTSEDFN